MANSWICVAAIWSCKDVQGENGWELRKQWAMLKGLQHQSDVFSRGMSPRTCEGKSHENITKSLVASSTAILPSAEELADSAVTKKEVTGSSICSRSKSWLAEDPPRVDFSLLDSTNVFLLLIGKSNNFFAIFLLDGTQKNEITLTSVWISNDVTGRVGFKTKAPTLKASFSKTCNGRCSLP